MARALRPGPSCTVNVSPPQRSPSRFPGLIVVGALLLGAAWAGVSCIDPGEHRFAVTGEACVTCHRADYDRSTLPGHDEFPLECANCHEESHWQPAEFPDHERFFPLHGAHAEIECTKCHATGFEPGTTPKECVGCHRKDYDSSPFPGHEAYPTTCVECHTTQAWQPATIPGHDEFFVIDGAHTEVTCAGCHTKGYDPGMTPTTCVGCHQQDYDSSPYPGHQDFAMTCTDCHTTKAWKPASGGTHPEKDFPIATGPHEVVECMECHDSALGPNGKSNTDCIQCHKRSRWDAEHHEVRDYPSGPAPVNFCLNCHARGTRDED